MEKGEHLHGLPWGKKKKIGLQNENLVQGGVIATYLIKKKRERVTFFNCVRVPKRHGPGGRLGGGEKKPWERKKGGK